MKTPLKQPCRAERLLDRSFCAVDDWVSANPAVAMLLGICGVMMVVVLLVHGLR